MTDSERVTSVQERLLKLNTRLHVTDSMFVGDRNRMSQFLSRQGGLIHIDFWENGMCWHGQYLPNEDKVSLALYLWNDLRLNSNEIEKEIPEIQFPASRKKIEAGNQEYISWRWQEEVKNAVIRSKAEAELIELLSKNPIVNKLMTFHQLWDFGLSRQIGNYGGLMGNDLPRATIMDGDITVRTPEQALAYHVKGATECIGKGTAKEAVKFIENHLPEGIDWAEYQTLEQYEERVKKQEYFNKSKGSDK